MPSNDHPVDLSSSKSAAAVATPRLSASLILLNEKNEVLMIQRMKDSRTFAGMHAFPGGNYDPAQDGPDADPRMTAIRETFEETGILLASPKDASKTPSPSDLAQGRRAIHSRTDPTTFPSFLAAHGLTAETSIEKLIPFSQWVTPVGSKSRFWTWFYVGFLQEMKGILAAEDASVSNVSGVLSPTHDNHIEIQSAYFQQPRAIIDSFDKGDISFMPPQFYLLTMLTDIIDLHARERHSGNANSTAGYMREVAGRQFGGRVFNPRFGGKYTGDDGVERSILMYEGDGMYDGKDGDKRVKHRSLLTFKDGRPSSIEIQRDIDLLGLDSSDKSSGPSAKL